MASYTSEATLMVFDLGIHHYPPSDVYQGRSCKLKLRRLVLRETTNGNRQGSRTAVAMSALRHDLSIGKG